MIFAPGRRAARLPVHRVSPLIRLTSPITAIPSSPLASCLGHRYYSRRALAPSFDTSQQHRRIHSSERRTSTVADNIPGVAAPLPESCRAAPLSILPISMILRSLATTVVSSSPILLPPLLRIMDALAHSEGWLLNPDRNPVLRYLLKKTFYAQFCAGDNAPEVNHTITKLKQIGFNGVILVYAKEVVLSKDQAEDLGASKVEETLEDIANEINPWMEGTLQTVRLVKPGDFVSIKFTGAGRLALYQLTNRQSPSPYLYKAIDSICQLAHERGVRLLIDAEQDMLQEGIDDWTMEFTRKYNTSPKLATVYGTYQTYKKNARAVLSQHLADAQKGGFTLGVKLVRGAYLGSDPRECFHDTKEETDACFNSLAASVLTRQWSSSLGGEGEYPNVYLVLATHNAESVQLARAICDAGDAKTDVEFAQLQGMADEVSCELVEANQAAQMEKANALAMPVYKYLVWGTTGECMKYLLRRAQENKDAVQRTRSSRDAMWTELVRRCKSAVGMA